jgi:hypothetical protein|tara:strand:+ start:76 stop:396 length:321 start_codon:yes stop_codon:yes gene_type:complete
MSSSDIVKAIRAINKDAQIVVYGNDLDTCTIQWDVGTEISKADIQTKLDELQADYDSLVYARARESAYPSTKDFMEAYTEKEIGGNTGKWDAYVINYNKVRSDNPK